MSKSEPCPPPFCISGRDRFQDTEAPNQVILDLTLSLTPHLILSKYFKISPHLHTPSYPCPDSNPCHILPGLSHQPPAPNNSLFPTGSQREFTPFKIVIPSSHTWTPNLPFMFYFSRTYYHLMCFYFYCLSPTVIM